MASGSRPTVYFHVGAPKTGTTYLQRVLWRNRDALRRDDVLYPGRVPPAHFWACLDLRDAAFQQYRAPRVPGAWGRLVDEIRDWHAVSVIDHELFSPATEAQVRRAMGDLGFAEVHLVYTARDMARQLPAVWQESVKNGASLRFDEFLDSVCRDTERDEVAQRFWAMQDTSAVLARWSCALPPERVHVITVPPPGSPPSVLWERFGGLVGLDPDAYDIDVGPSNTSLAAAEATVLRRFNAEIRDMELPWPFYAKTVKDQLGRALASRGGPRIVLPAEQHEWAKAWSTQTVEKITQAGYHVVGDLDELIPGPASHGQGPDSAPAHLQAEAAVAGMALLLRQVHGSAQPKTVAQPPDRGRPVATAQDGAGQSRPRLLTRVKRSLVARSARGGWLGALYRLYRQMRRRSVRP